MNELARRWIGIIGVLVLVYLVVRNSRQFAKVVDAATSGQVGLILRLQGRPAGQYVS